MFVFEGTSAKAQGGEEGESRTLMQLDAVGVADLLENVDFPVKLGLPQLPR